MCIPALKGLCAKGKRIYRYIHKYMSIQNSLPHLLALHQEQDWGRAASECQMLEADLMESVRAAESEYGRALVVPGAPFRGFTREGESVVASARQFFRAVDDIQRCSASLQKKENPASWIDRRSVSPKRLGLPAPTAKELDRMIEAALSSPDHGSLRPWRFIVFSEAHRGRLAELFVQEKLRRDPLASEGDMRRAREHATRSPTLLAFVVSPKTGMRVPIREQWLAAGAALGNFMNAVHQLGFGGIVLSGERCFDAALSSALGLKPSEFLAGFVSLGSSIDTPPQRKPIDLSVVRTHWIPDAGAPIPDLHGERLSHTDHLKP